MTIRATDPILGPSRGDPVKFLAVFVRADAKDADYVMGIAKWARIAGVDSAIAFVQFCQECTDPGANSPGTSVRWNRDLNPAGIGIPLDTTGQPVVINDGDEAARLHVQCLYSLVKRVTHPGVPIPSAWLPWFKSVWLPKVCDVLAPDVRTLADLNIRYVDTTGEQRATWAWDAAYLTGLLAYAAKWLSNVPDVASTGKDHPVPDAYAYVPTPVRKQLLPVGWPTRPGTKLLLNRGWIGITVHETANEAPGANAAMHANWVRTQDAVNHQVSISFFVDDHEIVQITPLDEMTWHAGDGCNDPASDIGCFYTISIEKCVNAGANEAKANENLAELIARVAQGDPAFDWGSGITRGKVSTDHLYQHIDVSQEAPPHDCPNHIRHETLPGWNWQKLMDAVDWFAPYVAANLKGSTYVPAPTPAPAPTPKPMQYAEPTKGVAGVGAAVSIETLTFQHDATPRLTASLKAKVVKPGSYKAGQTVKSVLATIGTDKQLWRILEGGQRVPNSAFYK